MTGKKKRRRVSLIPKRPDDMDPIIRWGIGTHLHLIEEVACGSEASGIGAPDMEKAAERIVESLGTDWKANEEAAVDRMRAEVTTWWQDFPDRQLLTDLYRRAARRKAKCGSADSGREPSHSEGLRVARGLLAHIPDTGPWDSGWEYAAVSTVLAAFLLPPIGIRTRPALRAYIKRSRSSRIFYDALLRICVELDKRGEAISPMLAKWRWEVVGGQRLRPARKARPLRVRRFRPRPIRVYMSSAAIDKASHGRLRHDGTAATRRDGSARDGKPDTRAGQVRQPECRGRQRPRAHAAPARGARARRTQA